MHKLQSSSINTPCSELEVVELRAMIACSVVATLRGLFNGVREAESVVVWCLFSISDAALADQLQVLIILVRPA